MAETVYGRFPLPPGQQTLGFELLQEWPEEGRIEVAFHPDATMLNRRGNVQGGFIAAMLDDTMGPALIVSTEGREAPVSVDLNVTFLRPVAPGRVIARGRVVSRDARTAELEAELFDLAGNLLARASSNAMIVPNGQ